MKKTLPKCQRITTISFHEADPIIRIVTYNTDLKRRLLHYEERFPDICKSTGVVAYVQNSR